MSGIGLHSILLIIIRLIIISHYYLVREDVFINSAYSKVTSANGIMNPEKLRQALNFEEDIRNMEQKNLFPLMAKYDQIIKFDLQSLDFNPGQVIIIPFGHATGATKFKLLRQHILKGIDN